ncbi:GntR family transcriptional regulator [Microlunatus soli]|uniref:GntR family transcriptional regulator n=1 Tax=Microlunatus soli TaxID=630515 RepID=A0A1H1UHP3_9ACTN|nr:GntR family transcriptional regulator [Microlunatus soli]SDS72027.1 GntR family transcriptional regulator [Microlunatus soli]
MPERPTPAHEVITRHLRTVIAAAAPGDRLPSDRELSTTFHVSRMTARQAISALVGEGRLYRVSGSGTYVADHPVHRRVTRLLSFAEHMHRQGRQPSAVVLESGRRAGNRQENVDLAQGSDAQVGELKRLLKGDGIPIGVEEVRLPDDCCSVLELDLGTGSLFAALAAIGREPTRSKGTVTAESAMPELARLLDVAVGAALIVQRQIVLDADDRPVQLAVTRYVGDRFVFDIDQEKHAYADPVDHEGEPAYEVGALVDRP